MKIATILIVIATLCNGCSSPSKESIDDVLQKSSNLYTGFRKYSEEKIWELGFNDEKRIPEVIIPLAQAVSESLRTIQIDWRNKRFTGHTAETIDSLIGAFIMYVDNTQTGIRLHYDILADQYDKEKVKANVNAAQDLIVKYTTDLQKNLGPQSK